VVTWLVCRNLLAACTAAQSGKPAFKTCLNVSHHPPSAWFHLSCTHHSPMRLQVESLGFESPGLAQLECNAEAKIRLANVLFAVLSRFRTLAKDKRDQDDVLHRTLNDVTLLRSRVERYREDAEKEAQVCTLRSTTCALRSCFVAH
jgi:hypothetical protein